MTWPEVRLVSDGNNDSHLEIDGKEVWLPILEIKWIHTAGRLPRLSLVLEAIECDVAGILGRKDIEIIVQEIASDDGENSDA